MKTSSIRKQRGALGLMMAMMMLVLVLFAALAIDMARLTYQQQALQSVADVAALEVSRSNPYFIDGDMTSIASELEAKYEGKVDTLTVKPGSAKIEGNQWVFSKSKPSVPTFNSDYPAAQVVVTKKVDKSMIAGGLFDNNKVELTATAAIQKSGVVRFGIGTELLNVNAKQSELLNSIFTGILGSPVNLSAAGYKGLVDTQIMLGSLVNQATIGSMNEVLNSNLELANLSEFLDLDGGVGALLNQVSALDVKVGDILGITPGRESAALGTTLSALDIIRASVYAAHEGNGIELDNLGITIPGVSSINANLKVVEAPQFKTVLLPIKEGDNTLVKTSQLDLSLVVDLVPGLGVGTITVDAKGAESTAKIIEVGGDENGKYIKVQVSSSLSDFDISLGMLDSLITADINVTVSEALPSIIKVSLSDLSSEEVYTKKISNLISFTDINSTIKILGIISLGDSGVLNGIVSSLLSDVLLPTLGLLGVSLNETTIWVDAAGTTQYGLIQ
ncbi:pilus assembly protein TadG-related protein [Vibrio sp.]|uniref:pilus assembly protein TadG-related protein n=1 Tax=Vibrio sp. TaxID=678 RepID=UPI003AA816D1